MRTFLEAAVIIFCIIKVYFLFYDKELIKPHLRTVTMFTTPLWQEVFVWFGGRVNTMCVCWGIVRGGCVYQNLCILHFEMFSLIRSNSTNSG